MCTENCRPARVGCPSRKTPIKGRRSQLSVSRYGRLHGRRPRGPLHGVGISPSQGPASPHVPPATTVH